MDFFLFFFIDLLAVTSSHTIIDNDALTCSGHSACIAEDAEYQEQDHQQDGVCGPQANTNGNHSGRTGPGTGGWFIDNQCIPCFFILFPF